MKKELKQSYNLDDALIMLDDDQLIEYLLEN